MQWTAVADEWGTAMIELDGRTPHLVEFDLHFDDGGWWNDGVRYENDEVLHLLRYRRTQAEKAVVSIRVDSEATTGELLPLLLACQRTGVEFTLANGDDQNRERKMPLRRAVTHVLPIYRTEVMLGMRLPEPFPQHNIWLRPLPPHSWFPEQFQISGEAIGMGFGGGRGGCGIRPL